MTDQPMTLAMVEQVESIVRHANALHLAPVRVQAAKRIRDEVETLIAWLELAES